MVSFFVQTWILLALPSKGEATVSNKLSSFDLQLKKIYLFSEVAEVVSNACYKTSFFLPKVGILLESISVHHFPR